MPLVDFFITKVAESAGGVKGIGAWRLIFFAEAWLGPRQQLARSLFCRFAVRLARADDTIQRAAHERLWQVVCSGREATQHCANPGALHPHETKIARRRFSRLSL